MCRNTDFTATSADTRAGINLTMQGINKSPVTGLLMMKYNPETAVEQAFEFSMLFDLAGALQYEQPVGSGRMVRFPAGLFVPPANTQMIATQAANLGFLAFSDLKTAKSGVGVANPKTLNLDPYGMKPVGWTWLPGQPVLVGEMATPTTQGGNGHTYRCITAGVTGQVEPVWPTVENDTVVDDTAEWEEYTLVLANRLPAPTGVDLFRAAGLGTFAAGLDVYIAISFENGVGESLPTIGLFFLPNTNLNDAVRVAVPGLGFPTPGWIGTLLAPYAPTGIRIYQASVATGSPAPQENVYQYYGTVALGSTTLVTHNAASAIPPATRNTARITPGQLPVPTDAPVISRSAGAGTFPAGRDVYVLQTYTNNLGETTAGPASSVLDTNLNDAVEVNVAGVPLYPQITAIKIYEADVATGSPAPPASEFALVGSYQPGDNPVITAAAAGPPPPTVNTTGPGGNIIADTPDGGINGTQGLRYAALMFMNRNETVSGFTRASVVSYDVDEDGWELAVFNVAAGPSNIVGRIVAFTVADGTQSGPFNWIGLVNLIVPSQNFVYPQTTPSDGIQQSATVFLDNVTPSGTFNFTDEFLIASNNVTDRLRVVWPGNFNPVRIDYLPSIDRMVLTGVAGYSGGAVISLGGDLESFYGDTSPVPVSSTSGERSWGTVEYRNIIYLMRERSGVILSPTANDPATWGARERWDQTGPCGPRAFDACTKFMIYVHQSGIYRYVDTTPDLMTKEMPNWWATINWAVAETICVTIDEFTHTVRFLFPVNGSAVPNLEVSLSYIEGWNNPVHYATISGKEIAMDAARRYSLNDVQANLVERIYRTIPQQGQPGGGANMVLPADQSFFISQLVYGSSGPDGAVHARTPGIFNDNGAGIDWRYRTASAGALLRLSKIEGFVLNCSGFGTINAVFLAAREMVSAWHPKGKSKMVPVRAFDLLPDQASSITRKVPTKLNEFWSLEFNNGKKPDVWCSLKFLKVYTIPFADSREENEG